MAKRKKAASKSAGKGKASGRTPARGSAQARSKSSSSKSGSGSRSKAPAKPSKPARAASKPKKQAPAPKVQLPPKQAAPKRIGPTSKKVLSGLINQRKETYNQLRRLERQFDRENRRTKQDQIRRQIKATNKALDKVREQIPKQRKQIKHEVELRNDKQKIYSKRYRLNKKLKELYESGGQAKQAKQYEKLTNQYNYLGGKLREINRELGYEVPRAVTGSSTAQPAEGGTGGGAGGGAVSSQAGFFKEPSPLASWQVQAHIKDVLSSGNWKSVTVNGEKYDSSDPTGEIMLRMAMANFAKDVYKQGSDVTIDVSFNPDSGEFIYDVTR